MRSPVRLFLVIFLITCIQSNIATLAAEFEYRPLIGPCDKDCNITIYSGESVNTPMYDIFLDKHLPPWNWRFGKSYLVAGALSRPFITYGTYFDLEAEIGVGKRFGLLHQQEIWGAVYFRYKEFPWNNYVRTTVAISTGINYSTDIPRYEKQRSQGPGANFLHFLSPEITFGLPQYPNADIVVRFHHRSGGGLRVFNNAIGGVQYGTLGIRYRW